VSTQPTGPSASAPPSAAEQTKPFRQLIALVLLAGTAVLLLLAFARLLLVFDDFGGGFTQRANATFADFVGLPQMIALAVAVLIATHVRPPVPMARVITLVALIEVAFAAFFGHARIKRNVLRREAVAGFGLKPDAVIRRKAVNGKAAVLISGG